MRFLIVIATLLLSANAHALRCDLRLPGSFEIRGDFDDRHIFTEVAPESALGLDFRAVKSAFAPLKTDEMRGLTPQAKLYLLQSFSSRGVQLEAGVGVFSKLVIGVLKIMEETPRQAAFDPYSRRPLVRGIGNLSPDFISEGSAAVARFLSHFENPATKQSDMRYLGKTVSMNSLVGGVLPYKSEASPSSWTTLSLGFYGIQPRGSVDNYIVIDCLNSGGVE